MKNMNTKLVLAFVTVLAPLAPAAAFAEGAVKVECWGRCDLVNLGQICDSYSLGSQPVAVACDDTAVGAGPRVLCGSVATCTPFGSLVRGDLLSAYCDDGGANDAVVTCRALTGAALPVPALPKTDDAIAEPDSK